MFSNLVQPKHTKHIEIDIHFIREKILLVRFVFSMCLLRFSLLML
jgi:hypothetical protein